jgi:hypothetical protein
MRFRSGTVMDNVDYVRSRKQTAARLNISLKTLHRMEKRGEAPPRVQHGRCAPQIDLDWRRCRRIVWLRWLRRACAALVAVLRFLAQFVVCQAVPLSGHPQ